MLPPPLTVTRYLESNGLERSLSTNIPDHPTAIQVNGLRQERTEHVMCPGHISGVNSYDARTLCGNWAEERCDKAYAPSELKASKGNDWQFPTTYAEMTKHIAPKVLPSKGSNAETMYTVAGSAFATGVKESSRSSNAEIVKLGGDFLRGDHRSASRLPGNYVNYQAGLQHLISQAGGRINALPEYETTTQAGFADPAEKRLPTSTSRCDVAYKPPFQIRDPGTSGKSKMLCSIKDGEFACDDDSLEHIRTHVLGKPVKDKQKVYTIEEYRKTWTKSAPEMVEAGLLDTSEHRARYQTPDLGRVDATRKMAGHVGSWH